MTMRYGTDEAEAGRRRLKRSPVQKDPRTVRVDPSGNVTPRQRPAPKRTTQPKAAARQAVNQPPMASPVPNFRNMMAQQGMINPQPIYDYGLPGGPGPGVGYSINPMHSVWGARMGHPDQAPGPQFPQGMNPMDYYGSDFFRGTQHYQPPGTAPAVPRVWTQPEMDPSGFLSILRQYGMMPQMPGMQMNPYGF